MKTSAKPQPKEFHIPGEMLFALKTRPKTEWDTFFEGLVAEKLKQIPGCTTTEQLLQVQAGAKELQVLHQFFIAEMAR